MALLNDAPGEQLPLTIPASAYEPVDDLALVTSYFNPRGYRTKRANLDAFLAPIRRAGLHCEIVECRFDELGERLPSIYPVRSIRADAVLWQKERLLNVAIQGLPPRFTKIAWLDADLLFARPDWAVAASKLLESKAVVQLFDRVIRLPRGHWRYDGAGEAWSSFGAVAERDPHIMTTGRFDLHGHTGFAWAIRREALDGVGLYDACIAGSGDHMMAHAFSGDWDSTCVDRIVGSPRSPTCAAHRRYFEAWCRRIYPRVRARVGAVSGTVLHLWHGETADRRYVLRNRELMGYAFDPERDLRIGAGGAWEWASDKPELHAWARRYFEARREDGQQQETQSQGDNAWSSMF